MSVDPLTARTADELLRTHTAFDTDDEDLAERPPLNAQRDDKAILSPRKRKAGDVFGDEPIDEEIKIAKQRRKIPKLDTDRLISEPGLPKVRKLQRSGELQKNLRLKGKGHEFSNAARLLNFYQMWLDNLYPRAKFADAVKMVEKAGHTKKMQMYRKSWIDEGKPGHVRQEEVDNAFEVQEDMPSNIQQRRDSSARLDFDKEFDEDPSSMFFGGDDESIHQDQDGPDDDELDALLAQDSRPSIPSKQPIDVDSEGEDDLDAILAQSNQRTGAVHVGGTEPNTTAALSQSAGNEVTPETEDEDDLDTLLHQAVPPKDSGGIAEIQPHVNFDDEDFPDDDIDEFDALINLQNPSTEPELPRNISTVVDKAVSENDDLASEEVPELENVVSSSPIPNIHTDELDQLMDEHDALTERKKRQTDLDIVEEFMSSSPIQN